LVGNTEPVEMGFSKSTMYITIGSLSVLLFLLGFYLKKGLLKRKLVFQNF